MGPKPLIITREAADKAAQESFESVFGKFQAMINVILGEKEGATDPHDQETLLITWRGGFVTGVEWTMRQVAEAARIELRRQQAEKN